MSIKVPLKYPVKDPANPTAKISELNLRRPLVSDQLAVSEMNTVLADIHLFANLTMQTPEVIQALDWGDYLELQDAYNDFFPKKKKGRQPKSLDAL